MRIIVITNHKCFTTTSGKMYPLLFTVADFDGDDVRCRLASGTDECSSICGNISIISSFNGVRHSVEVFRLLIYLMTTSAPT